MGYVQVHSVDAREVDSIKPHFEVGFGTHDIPDVPNLPFPPSPKPVDGWEAVIPEAALGNVTIEG